MKAIFQTGYGSPDFFELREIEKPQNKDNEVLVRVHTAAVNAGDVYCMRGDPRMVRLMAGMPKPKNYIPGYDVAGTVEAVGKKAGQFKAGDEVFGAGQSTFAEYACVKEKNLVPGPNNLGLEESAGVPTSALTALQGLRDIGKIKPGQKVLINGASGGVGSFAVQIARAYGAEVTGVCSTKNVELVRSMGADHVIDYTRNDFTRGGLLYDLILDQVTNHSMSACRKVLGPRGRYIPNSGNSGLGHVIKAMIVSMFISKQERSYLSVPKKQDLLTLKELIEEGKVKPVIDKIFPLSETSAAFRHLEEVHASGKVLISMYQNKSNP